MRCPKLSELPPPPSGKTGWPWTEESPQLPDTLPDGRPWPKVSIVTPSYNQGLFIEESIRSVLLQGYPDLEYIVFDGGSTDNSVEIIKKYEPWLVYWVSEPDRGQSHAINKGLERSTGQFFNWQNSDDILTVNSLATTAAVMVDNPDASYVHGYSIAIDEHSKILFYNYNDDLFKDKAGFILNLAWSVSNLKGGCQPGCLMERDLVVQLGGIDESLEFIMDLDLALRLALVKLPFYVDYPVISFRQHPEAKGFSRHSQRAGARLTIAHKLFSRQDLPPEILKLRRKALATAHQYAWEAYAKAKMRRFILWHVLQNIFYSPLGHWGARLSTLYQMACEIMSSAIAPFRRIKKPSNQAGR